MKTKERIQKVQTEEFRCWLVNNIPNLTKSQRFLIEHGGMDLAMREFRIERIVPQQGFTFSINWKKILLPLIWIVLVAGLPFHKLITRRWSYSTRWHWVREWKESI